MLQLKQFAGSEIAIVASGRDDQRRGFANSAIWAKPLGVKRIDVVPRRGKADHLPAKIAIQTRTARGLILGFELRARRKTESDHIASAVRSGGIRGVGDLEENVMHLGLSVQELAQTPAGVVMNTLPNEATKNATVVLPACGVSAEKRGSMANGKGRLQRFEWRTRPPGNARDDWEILRDLLQAIGGGDSLHSIEDVFRRISETVPNSPD